MNRTRGFAALASAIAFTLAIPTPARAWHAGTHLFVAQQLRRGGAPEPDELRARRYGANGPDLFNYVLAEPYLTAADYLHDYLGENAAERLWAVALEAGDPVLMQYAYGFAAHDNALGADHTAHLDAVTRGLDRGYVIEKAEVLAALIGGALPVPPDQLAMVTHLLVEFGVDVLVRQELDPALGEELLASIAADAGVGPLLADAFAEPLAPYFGTEGNARMAILFMEQKYRSEIIPWYALALAQEDPFVGVAGWISQAAGQLLGIPFTEAQAQQALYVAMELCRGDYQPELFATIGRTNANLATRHIAVRP